MWVRRKCRNCSAPSRILRAARAEIFSRVTSRTTLSAAASVTIRLEVWAATIRLWAVRVPTRWATIPTLLETMEDEEVGDDTLMGGAGADTLYGGAGDDTLDGGEGNDADTLNGGPGSDMIYAGVGANGEDNDTIDAGSGTGLVDDAETDVDESKGETDIVSFAKVTDTDDTMDGDQGATINVESGWNEEQVHGSPFADTITGSSDRDMILGGDGDDTLSGGGGGMLNDGEFDKATADVLAGMGGDDTLNGDDNTSIEVFAVHLDGGDDTITNFGLGNDHLHFLGFTAGDVSCERSRGSASAVVCTAGSQTVDIETTGAFTTTPAEDLDGDLNIVVDPNG